MLTIRLTSLMTQFDGDGILIICQNGKAQPRQHLLKDTTADT